MRKLIFVLALIGFTYLAVNTYACYRRVFPARPTGRGYTLSRQAVNDPPPLELDPPAAELPSPRSQLDTIPPPPEPDDAAIIARPNAPAVIGGPEDEDDEYEPPPSPMAAALCAPGLMALNVFGLAPDGPLAWLFVILLSWAAWTTGLRLLWILPARYFGWGYSPRAFRYWLWLGIPWRPVRRALDPALSWLRTLSFGKRDTDRWMGFFQRGTHTFKPGQILLGRQSFFNLPCVQPLGLTTERGVTVCASVGSGKSSWLTSHLVMYPGNFLVVDCDGAILNAIGKRLERQGRRIVKYDPFNLAPDFGGACWNPLDELEAARRRYGEEAVAEFAPVLAEGLIKKDACPERMDWGRWTGIHQIAGDAYPHAGASRKPQPALPAQAADAGRAGRTAPVG